MNPRTAITLGTLLAATVGLSGCTNTVEGQPHDSTPSQAPTTTPAAPSHTLPPRPRDIDLTGLDPCEALTRDQARQLDYPLGYERPPYPGTDDYSKGPECAYGSHKRQIGALVIYSTSEGAEAWLNDPGRGPANNNESITIDGFPALQLTAKTKELADCMVVVSTHNNQYVRIYVSDDYIHRPPSEKYCTEARKIAGMVIQNLSK